MTGPVLRRGGCGAAVLACLLAPAAHAADDRGVHGAVGISVQHDDNLFKLPDGVSPGAVGVTRGDGLDTPRGDTVYAPFVSLSGGLSAGRQHLWLSALRRETKMDRYHVYDSTTGDLRGRWDWVFGNQLDGSIGAGDSDQASELRDFIGPRRNVLNVRDEHASLRWRPRPDRRLGLDVQHYRGRNDLAARAGGDYAVRVWGLEGGWTTSRGSEWTLRWRSTEGRYPNRTIVDTVPIDNSYHQRDADIGLVLQPGGRTRGELRLGHAVRHHAQVPQRDFEGLSGNASLTWLASGALTLDLQAVRDLNALDDFDRLFAISTNYALGARLAIAAQWQLSLRWSQDHIDYGGDPQNVVTQVFGQAPARRDRIQSTRLGLTWKPTDRVQVDLSLEQSQRDSNRAGLAYDSRTATLATQYSF